MPELPRGPHQAFVAFLFGLYRQARRPSLEKISGEIRRRDDLKDSVSKETVRKMMNGSTIPTRWEAVEAVLVVLCDMGGLDPDESGFEDSSRREELEFLWNEALDAPRPTPPSDDPWGGAPF